MLKATLDKIVSGPYTQHGGRFTTIKITDRLWQGTWQQPGNARESGIEVLLSENGTQANIPPREHGGTYHWNKLSR